jgi:hypothetical protein
VDQLGGVGRVSVETRNLEEAMSVYVDQIVERYLVQGTFHRACHMLADSEKELEAFAKRLQLNKSWRHGDHYDLTPLRRAQAIKLGAISVDARTIVRIRRKNEDRLYGKKGRG